MTMSPADGGPEEERNEALELFLQQLGSRDDVPAFVRNVEQIHVVVHDPKARVQLLNAAIMSDVALSLKVLRIANSAIYAAAGRTVQTVYQAIMLLGFERMKDIAVSASVFEQFQSRTADMRELMACAVLTANQSLVLCSRTGFPRAEVAYLCGIFRNLGELVCASYRPTEYAAYKAMPRADDDEGAAAERAAFGFRFDEVGQAIARQWGLPPAITDAMYRPPSLVVARGEGPGTLAAITQLSSDLTNAIYRGVPWEQQPALRSTIARYGRGLGLDDKGALDAAREALEASVGALQGTNAGLDPEGFRERIDFVRELVLGPPEGEAPRRRTTAQGQVITDADLAGAAGVASARWCFGPEDAPPDVLPTAEQCAAVAHSLRDAVGGGHLLGTDEAVSRTVAALLDLGFQRAALLLAADGHTRLRVRTALGEGSEYLGDRLSLTLVPPNGALALAVVRREDVFAELKASSPFRSDPGVRRLRSASFTMLPVVVAGQTIGALFADSVRRPIEFSDRVRAPILDVRDSLQSAFERLRALAQQGRQHVGAA